MRKSFIFLWVFLVLVILFFWIYFPVMSHYRELKDQEEYLTAEIDQLNAKIKALKEERKLLLHDPVYFEKVVRDELGLVKPGEVVYKLVEESAAGIEGAEPMPDPVQSPTEV